MHLTCIIFIEYLDIVYFKVVLKKIKEVMLTQAINALVEFND